MKEDTQHKAVLNYRAPVRTRRYSGWGVAAVEISIGGLLVVVFAGIFPHPAPGATDYRIICVPVYFVCLILGLVFSAIGYARDRSQRFFCFLAFLVSLLQILFVLTIALLGVLLSRK